MDHYEQELHRALRWYPRHYRERNGEEIVATGLDLREPGAATPGPAQRWSLAVAGMRTRLRERPRLSAWARYRFLGTRVPYRYRMWVRDDITGRGFIARRLGWSLATLLVPIAALAFPTAVGAPVYAGIDPWVVEYTATGFIPKAVENLAGLCLIWAAVWAPLQGLGQHNRTVMLGRHGFHPNGRSVGESAERPE